MSTPNDGGPAFPVPAFTPGLGFHDSATEAGFANTRNPGMSLRDWFAGQALAGLLANAGGPIQANGMSGWGFTNCRIEDVALTAYGMADAMLAARGKQP